ncbi:hypothetical protein [Roseovarius sp. Pro17]|uniref:hypothetical protein n=1 Tax=Roseovarius sp. Pro17 TaxID=3108175 RepID=UPI002D77338A|nr:hypothetical protein [Roseovarius sp. Pro17]
MTKIIPNRTVTHTTAWDNFLVRWLAAGRENQLSRRDHETLSRLPVERLADMGIPATTDANRRTSGEAGLLPPADLW